MSLMINQNITALNAWRNLGKTDREMSGVMEKLSSGLRINKASDDPAGLVISEQMRAQVVGLNAAIKNSEKGVSMIQTAEAALDKVHSLLDKMRGLALDSANNATNDTNMLAANQAEIDNILSTITRISDMTQYGTKKLLNGDNANTAVVNSAAGTGVSTLDVVESTLETGAFNLAVTVNTPGQAVFNDGGVTNLTMVTTPADAVTALSEATHHLVVAGTTYEATGDLTAGASLKADGVTPGDAAATGGGVYKGAENRSYTFTLQTASALTGNSLSVSMTYDDGVGHSGTATWVTDGSGVGTFTDVSGNLDGATLSFTAGTAAVGETFTLDTTASTKTASLDGAAVTRLFDGDDNSAVQLTSGLTDGGTATFNLETVGAATVGTATIDVTKNTYDATLNNAAAGTAGTTLTSFKAADGVQTFEDGNGGALQVDMANLAAAGTIQFTNTDNSLVFQIGANQDQTVKISIIDVSADTLARGIVNASGFQSLAEITVLTAQKATDAIGLIDRAIDQISVIRGDLGAFQANTLEANLDSLRVATENLQASESTIRDADMAAEMAQFTKYQIMLQAGTAMLAQANQAPQNLLRLLQG